MTTLFQRVLGNLLSGLVGSFVMAVSQLALISFIVARVDLAIYGAALLLVSVFDTLELVRAQLARSTFKFLAEYISGPKTDTLTRIMSSSLVLHIVAGLAVLGVCWGLIPFLESLFTMPPELVSEASLALRLSGVVVCLSYFLQPQVHLLSALERLDLHMAMLVVGRVSRLVFTIIALIFWERQVLGIVVSILAGDLLAQCLGLWWAYRLYGWAPMKLGMVSSQWIKRILRFNLFDSLHPLSEIMYRHVALFLTAQFISLGAVAQLRVLFTVARMVLIVASQPGEILVPTASRLHATGESDKLRNGMLSGSTATVFLGCLTLVAVVPWVHWLLALWVGAEFVPLTYLAILFLSGSFLRYSASCVHGALVGVGAVAWDGLSDLAATVVGMGTGLLLVHYLQADLTNLGIGLFLCDVLRWAFLVGYGCRTFGVNPIRFLWESYFRATILAFLFIMAIYWLGLSAHTWLRLVVFCGAGAVLYGVVAFFLVLPLDIRGRLYDLARGLWQTVAARLGR